MHRYSGGFLAVAIMLAEIVGASPIESLLIGPGDLLHIQVIDAPEMDEHPRVTDAGEVPIPGAGNVRVAGLTPAAAANLVHDRLIAAHYMNHPQVVVTVDQYATQSVSVLGEVKLSGAYPIGTGRSILDVLALAGGLTPDADRNILIERRADPGNPIHYNVSNDAGKAIAEQVTVYPGDTIVVPKAGIVYILGDVNRPGGYVMTNNESQMTVLQAVAMAGGLTRAAKQGHARLIRKEAGGGYSDRELPIGKMQEGKLADIAMLPEDIVYIPFSYAKNIATSGAAGIVASAASASIYQLP